MSALKTFKVDGKYTGWKKLDDIIKTLIAAINEVCPIAGANITCDYTDSGTIIRSFAQNNSSGGTNQVVQPSSGPVVWHGVAWQTVTVVDPASCAQSQISVLVQQPGSSITIS